MDSIFFYTNQQIIAIMKNVSVKEFPKIANVYLIHKCVTIQYWLGHRMNGMHHVETKTYAL